jgi:hypothetical protein
MQQRIEEALRGTGRVGVGQLILYLSASDFYTAPCSTKFHLAVPGGLAQHTFNVMQCAQEISNRYDYPSPPESVTIAAFAHDLCKINFYKEFNEPPTDPQMRYLTSLMTKHGLTVPGKLNKAYVGILIDFMLKSYSRKTNDIPPYTPNYIVEDQMPLGHGEKSLYIMRQFVELSLDEALAVRWHMGFSDPGVNFNYPSGYPFQEAMKKSKLLSILNIADIEATNLMEV